MQIPKIEEQLLLALLPKDEADERDIVLEVMFSALRILYTYVSYKLRVAHLSAISFPMQNLICNARCRYNMPFGTSIRRCNIRLCPRLQVWCAYSKIYHTTYELPVP